jgi:glycosyltransferase involved in cell wall biosynthesis
METVKESLDSILSQVDQSFEVIVVDSQSDDGSLEVLKNYEKEKRIRLLSKSCNRGEGRQIAFEMSRGEVIISNMDLDDLFRQDSLSQAVRFFHSRAEDVVLRVAEAMKGAGLGYNEQAVTIARASLLKSLGGWKPLVRWEDWELWARAAKAGKYAWTCFPMRTKVGSKARRGHGREDSRLWRYRTLARIGRQRYNVDKPTLGRVLYDWTARASLIGQRKENDPFYATFDHKSTENYVSFEVKESIPKRDESIH